MNMIMKTDDTAWPREEEELVPTNQRENVFFTRVYVHDKVCVVGIGGGNSANYASSFSLVQELGLPTQKHPKPYNYKACETINVRVEEQVLVPISMGWYTDVIRCDVVPMVKCHLLLGRPWQYDRRAFHDAYNNTYTFQIFDKMVTLISSSPKQIMAAQIPIEKTIILSEPPIQDQTQT